MGQHKLWLLAPPTTHLKYDKYLNIITKFTVWPQYCCDFTKTALTKTGKRLDRPISLLGRPMWVHDPKAGSFVGPFGKWRTHTSKGADSEFGHSHWFFWGFLYNNEVKMALCMVTNVPITTSNTVAMPMLSQLWCEQGYKVLQTLVNKEPFFTHTQFGLHYYFTRSKILIPKLCLFLSATLNHCLDTLCDTKPTSGMRC